MKSRLSKYVFMFFTDMDRDTIGFTGSFRPVRIKIKGKINLLPGWYLVLKKPMNKTIIINDYSVLRYLDYYDIYHYRKLLLIRYTKLIRSGKRRIGHLKIISLRDLWNHMVGSWIYVLVLGYRSMFMFMGNYAVLSYYYLFKPDIRGKALVVNDKDLKISLVIIDSRNTPIPFRELFNLSYEQWKNMRIALIPRIFVESFLATPDTIEEDTVVLETLKKVHELLERRGS